MHEFNSWRRGLGQALNGGIAIAVACSLGISAANAQPAASVQDQGEGAARRIVVENPFLKLTVVPEMGGRVESLVHKRTGKDLALPKAGPESLRWGLLCDQLWQQSLEHSDWNHAPYDVEIAEKGPERVRLTLTGRGKHWPGVTIRKEIVVAAGRCAVDVEYFVSGAAPSPAKAGGDLWIYNVLPAGGRVFMPSETGVVERPESAEPEDWVYAPSRGWMAAVIGEAGLAATMDFSRVRALRTSQEDGTSLEWLLRKASLKPGANFKTAAMLAPFAGLKRVDGVCKQLAAQMILGEPAHGKLPVRVDVAPFESGAVTVNLGVCLLGKSEELSREQALALKADEPASVSVDAPIRGEGSFVVTCDVSAGGAKVLHCERLLVVGKPSGTYAMAPEGPRLGEFPDYPTTSRYHPIDFNFNSTGYVTPHRTWAKPYAGKRPKALFLLANHDARQAIEMAERFDLDITVPFITTDAYYTLGDRYMNVNMEDVYAALTKTVLSQKFDVIIMPAGLFRAVSASDAKSVALPEKVKQRIVQLVRDEGAGLVLTQRGDGPKELADALPLKMLGYDWTAGPYILQKSSNPVLNALPWEALPPGHAECGMKLRGPKPATAGKPASAATPAARATSADLEAVKPDAAAEPARERDTVLVSCPTGGGGGGPLIATTSWGKGRIVQMAINEPLMFGCATVRGAGDPMIDPPPYDYWEYQFAVFGRLIYWAARAETSVTMREIACTPQNVTATLSAASEGPVEAAWRLSDKFGNTLHSATQKAALVTPVTTLTLEVPAGVGAYYLADLVIRNEKGTLAWGAAVLKRSGAQIKAVKADKTMYDAKDSAQIAVTIQPAAPAGAMLTTEVMDGAGRVVARDVRPAAGESVQAAAPLVRVIGVVADFYVTLRGADGALLDQGYCSARIKADRDAERAKFQTFFWGGRPGSDPPYLLREWGKLYQYLGMSAEEENDGPLMYVRRELDYLNMPYIGGSVGMACNNGYTKAKVATPLPPATIESYRKAGFKLPDNATIGDLDVFSSPKTAEADREAGARTAKARLGQNYLMFEMGDENRAPLPDTDFTKAGLAEMRKWLKETQYKSLDELNAEWKTAFKTWDEVVPMTEAEIMEFGKRTNSYAAWADQQQFNKWAWARNAKAANEGHLSADPGCLAGESGTQAADTYSGRDYWLLMKYYKALLAYSTIDQENQQRSYRPDMLRYMWAGYGKPSPVLRTGTWMHLGTIDKGIPIFHHLTHVDPDFTINECGRDLRAIMIEMTRGAGQLLAETQPCYQPVYVLQSTASVHGAYAYGNKAYNEIGREGRTALIEIMNDLVIGYRHLSYEQVATGQLEKVGAKVLILPFSVALSKEECDAIRRWVQAGGTLINDMDAGIMTAHCRLLPQGQLDDVFGIDRSAAQIKTTIEKPATPPQKGNVKISWAVGEPTGDVKFPVNFVETGLRGSAKPLWTATLEAETAPVFFVNSFGKGKAYYLACDLFRSIGADRRVTLKDGSSQLLTPEGGRRMRFVLDMLEKVLNDGGCKARMAALSRGDAAGPARAPFLRNYTKVAGDQLYGLIIRDQGIFASATGDQPATIVFDRPGYLYDILSGCELGFGDRLDVTLTDYTVRALALLPYRVNAVNADIPATAAPGADVKVHLSVDASAKPGLHVFRVDVRDPKGALSRPYSQNAVARAGEADIVLPFALNDLAGDWTVRVRDVATGVALTKTLRLAAK